MKILRQKEYSWFGFGKKKQPDIQTPKIEYNCPTISDLPSNIQSSLKGVERVWKRPDVQKLISKLREAIYADGDPFFPYVDQKQVEQAHKTFLVPSLSLEKFPENTLMYPLMWNQDMEVLICYDINTGKFWYLNSPDYNFEEATRIRVLKDFIKNGLSQLEELNEDDIFMDPGEFKKLIKDLKKAFWI